MITSQQSDSMAPSRPAARRFAFGPRNASRSALIIALLFATFGSPAPGKAQLGDELNERSFNLIIEAGWRYPGLGHSRIPRDDDSFVQAYHGALTTMIGGDLGFYGQARFDGYGPTGVGPYPMMLSGRLGIYMNTQEWDAGGPRSSSHTSTSTDCVDIGSTLRRCTTTETLHTTSWWEPAGWITGARYAFAGYRELFNVEGDVIDPAVGDARDTINARAVSLGLGFIETKGATILTEIELLYFVDGWSEAERSRWGFSYHGQAILGPAFLDINILLDAGIGGELSIGLGFMLSP